MGFLLFCSTPAILHPAEVWRKKADGANSISWQPDAIIVASIVRPALRGFKSERKAPLAEKNEERKVLVQVFGTDMPLTSCG